MKRNGVRQLLVMLLDAGVVLLSYFITHLIRFDFSVDLFKEKFDMDPGLLLTILGVHVFYYAVFRLHRTIWAKVSVYEVLDIVGANVSAFLALIVIKILFDIQPSSNSVLFLMMILNIMMQFAFRLTYRYYRIVSIKESKRDGKRTLIYGAGDAGRMVLNEVLENGAFLFNIIGFIDDDLSLKNINIKGVPVFGDKKAFQRVIDQYQIDQVIVAMPSQPLSVQNKAAQEILKYNVDAKILPSSKDLLQSGSIQHSIREVNIQDLLERPEIVIEDVRIEDFLTGKKIMVTGAGGSIGSELVRQIMTYKPESVLLLDINETGLYELQQELKMKHDFNEIGCFAQVGSFRDEVHLEKIFKAFTPEIIFHAAAHKHVPLMEDAPSQAVLNNIFGTYNLIQLSMKYHVEKFVNISTDKAVNPTNVMGATKRFNEMMLQAYDKTSETKFVAVRFGNVLGSNGSVIPLFRRQIKEGGPLTVTHPDIIRYFMTIPEAVSLVLQAGTYADGGEIFVLDMGEPVKILTLAENLITLSGFKPYEDIKIEFTGLRPGEKLFEELHMSEEGVHKTENDLIFVAEPIFHSIDEIEASLSKLKNILDISVEEAIILLQEVVPTYKP